MIRPVTARASLGLLPLIFLLGVGACGPQPDGLQGLDLDDVLANHVKATGGADAYERLENIDLAVHVIEPQFTVDGAYRATEDGLMRVDIFAEGQNVFSEGVDANGAWQQGGAGTELFDIDREPAQILRRGADFNLRGLYDLSGRGHTARLEGRENIDGIDYYRIHLQFADGFERYYYINPDNWLVDRYRETSALHPDLDDEERAAETVFDDFEEHCGVLHSMRSRKIDIDSGMEIQSSRATRFACNVAPGSLNIERSRPPVRP